MADDLVPVPPDRAPTLPPELADAVRAKAAQSRAESTWKIYRRLWHSFEGWCYAQGFTPLAASPEAVAAYLTKMGEKGCSMSDLVQRRAAISAAYEARGLPPPTWSPLVRMVMKALRRDRRERMPVKKAAATERVLRQMLATLDHSTVMGKRDHAILVLGHVGALRRSEVCRIELSFLTKDERGYRLVFPWTKTDQEGGERRPKSFHRRADELCPVQAIEEWLLASKIASGLLFRRIRNGRVMEHGLDGKTVATIVKRCARLAGIEGDFSGHSLRAGFVTEALERDISIDKVQAQTHHKSIDVLLGYRRMVDPYEGNAAAEMAKATFEPRTWRSCDK